jgi:glycosyltransferase involved in cell wall biosynthesis
MLREAFVEARVTVNAAEFTFTVFTSTRNRAHTIERVYSSLRDQTFRDFEWIVVDNGSTDGTADLVRAWQAEADFPIRYLPQENLRKHVAMNRAVAEARGRFFLTIDSDDSCPPHALQHFVDHWESIAPERREQFSAVTALCVDEHGRLLGTRFPFDPTDSTPQEIHFRYRVTGEKWGFQRTDVMRRFPLPAPEDNRGWMPDSIIWNAIGREYLTRYVNDPLRIYWHDQPVSLTRTDRPLDDAPGAVLETQALLNHDLKWLRYAPWRFFLKAAKYSRSSFNSGRSAAAQWTGLSNAPARLLWLAGLPLGLALHLVDRLGWTQYARAPRLRPRRAAASSDAPASPR